MVRAGFVLRGAEVIDGTGAPSRRADVEIVGDRITAVGAVDDTGLPAVDLRGLVLAPGFIDMHTHYDAQVFWEPSLETSANHGVTTVLMGNCGFTVAPIRTGHDEHRDRLVHMLEAVEGMAPEVLLEGVAWGFESYPDYLARLDALPLGLNVASLVGHSAVRTYVMGDAASTDAATDEQVDQMFGLVADAVAHGAWGFSTSYQEAHADGSGCPVPSRIAAVDETERLIRAAATAGAHVIEVAWGEGFGVEPMARLANELGVDVTGAGLLTGMYPPEVVAQVLALVDRTEGRFRPQVICFPHSNQFSLGAPVQLVKRSEPFIRAVGLDGDALAAMYRDPSWRADAEAAFHPEAQRLLGTAIVAETTVHADLIGHRVADLAAEQGTSLLTTFLDLALADLPMRFTYYGLNDDEVALAELLVDRRTIYGLSDAGAHAQSICDLSFPTHLLGHWVRERGLLSPEDAVWRLTGQIASYLGLVDRGAVEVGRFADLVAYDPDRVGDRPSRRVRDLPTGADRLVAESDGIHHVWVNGNLVRKDEATTANPAGRLLRSEGKVS